jgi:PAS domain S-box-containing protein
VNNYLQVPGLISSDTAVTDSPQVPVLIVDDDDAKRFALKRLLAPLGFSIVEADSGVAALRCVLAQDFAAILLDLRMPGMDGFETAALIRTRPRSELTPIILVTASTRDEVAASGMYGHSVTDFMFAPLEPDELRATILLLGNLFRQASAKRWHLLAHAAPVGIFQTDRHHRYTYTNPYWSEITGIPAAAALGQDWRVIVDAEQASRLSVGFGAEVALRAEVAHRIEIRADPDGTKIVLLTSKLIPDADGGIGGWVGTLADVTARPKVF